MQDKIEMRKKLNNFSQEPSLMKGDVEIAVMVARSPHGQATTWAPVEIFKAGDICTLTVTPAQKISSAVAEKAQQMALEIAQEIKVVGVAVVELLARGEELFVKELAIGPHNFGNWSIEGAVTSQFEQHLRAILDLPLGTPAMNHSFVVMGNVLSGEKTDMYRPYLHLMARTPSLHFHQYKKEVTPGIPMGHITICGENLPDLIGEVEHACDYMSGVIDE
jgi:5-(carboxyamino)imidazole ribonucleotide synthase